MQSLSRETAQQERCRRKQREGQTYLLTLLARPGFVGLRRDLRLLLLNLLDRLTVRLFPSCRGLPHCRRFSVDARPVLRSRVHFLLHFWLHWLEDLHLLALAILHPQKAS